jgi:hypothetical protein
MPDYRALYPAGAWVQIVPRKDLEVFARTRFYRHDFKPEQLAYAGQVAQVQDVPCYLVGDALYHCTGLPGMWPEECLRPSAAPGDDAKRELALLSA